MTALRVAPRPEPRAITSVPRRRTGLARSVAIVLRHRTPEPPDPLTLDHRLGVATALRILAAHGQAMAFVASAPGRTGVVSAEDLRFAADWAGPRATVGDAVTQALVDLSPDPTHPHHDHIEEP